MNIQVGILKKGGEIVQWSTLWSKTYLFLCIPYSPLNWNQIYISLVYLSGGRGGGGVWFRGISMYRLWHQVHSFVYSQVYLFLGFEERVCCLYANPHYFTRIKPSHRSTLTLNDIQFQIYFSRRMRSHSISMSLCWWLLYDLKGHII